MSEVKDSKQDNKPGFDSDAFVEKHSEKGTKIFFGERVKLKVIKATKFYTLGQIIEPHKLIAQELIDNKIAEKVKSKEE